jgi:hypothetical protein
MANLFLIILMCLPGVNMQRHRVLCAIVGVEESSLCSKPRTIVTTTTPIVVLNSTTAMSTSTPMTTSKSYAYDFEYICLPFIIFFVYMIHVLYLHFGRALSWVDSLGYSAVRLVAIYRAAFGTAENVPAEVVCCPTVYNLCMDANVVGQSYNIAMPTSVAPIDD